MTAVGSLPPAPRPAARFGVDPRWLAPACAQVAAQLAPGPGLEALGTRAARAVQALLARQQLDSLEALALSPASTPFVPLLDALAQDLGVRPTSSRLVAAGEAALLSYLHVRVQDDVVDEPDAWDRSYTFVADAFATASVDAFARAVDGPHAARFFTFRAQQLKRFFGAAVTELDGRPDDAPLDERRLADKFLPLAVCLAAVAYGAGRPELDAALVRFTLAVGEALQRLNDLLNVAEDAVGRRQTPVLEALAVEGLLGPDVPPRLALLQSAALGEEQARARKALRWAEALARDAGLERLGLLAAARHGFVESVPQRLLRLQLGGGLG